MVQGLLNSYRSQLAQEGAVSFSPRLWMLKLAASGVRTQEDESCSSSTWIEMERVKEGVKP